MAARLSCALLVCAAASISATFVCGGDVQITQSWDGKSIEGHCDGDYEGAEFMPGDRVPFPDGPLLSGTLPAKLSLNLGIETLWLKNNLISGTIPSEWGGMRTLKELDLSGERLSGTVPTQLGLLAEMTTLNLLQIHHQVLHHRNLRPLRHASQEMGRHVRCDGRANVRRGHGQSRLAG